MQVMLERWNDDKMDALDAKVDAVVAELREQRQEMKAGFDRIHWLMLQFCGMMLAALIGLIATQL